jgi:hypothetical protein
MRKMTLLFTAAAAVVVSSFISFVPQKAEAAVIYPWCAHYGGGRMSGGGASNCGFLTRAQCMATIAGNGGFCDGNPWWQGPVPYAAAAPQVIPPRVQ